MNKIIVAFDSFKGSISSFKACGIVENKAKKIFENIKVSSIPIGDGGEGTIEAILYTTKGKKIPINVKNPYLKDISSYYAILDEIKFKNKTIKKVAIIESALAIGLNIIENKNPMNTSSYGVGELIKNALINGCDTIFVALGGSCTNDCGVGMACALGVEFYDFDNKPFIPVGKTLHKIKSMDDSNLLPLVKNANIYGLCDVDNPLFGDGGAAFVFASQKGANQSQVELLDIGLQSISNLLNKYYGHDFSNISGAGAAGGIGAGIMAFLNGTLLKGIYTILDIISFEKQLNDTDLVIVGEGCLDSQTLGGKAILGISKLAKTHNIPVVAVSGQIKDPIDKLYDYGISATFSINRQLLSLDDALKQTESNLSLVAEDIFRLIKSFDI